jgi:hypothetical protein
VHPWSVTEIYLLFYMCMIFVPHRKHLWSSIPCYGDSVTVLYVNDVRTSQAAQDSTARYGDSFTLLFVDDVRNSQETPMCIHGLLKEYIYCFKCV